MVGFDDLFYCHCSSCEDYNHFVTIDAGDVEDTRAVVFDIAYYNIGYAISFVTMWADIIHGFLYSRVRGRCQEES